MDWGQNTPQIKWLQQSHTPTILTSYKNLNFPKMWFKALFARVSLRFSCLCWPYIFPFPVKRLSKTGAPSSLWWRAVLIFFFLMNKNHFTKTIQNSTNTPEQSWYSETSQQAETLISYLHFPQREKKKTNYDYTINCKNQIYNQTTTSIKLQTQSFPHFCHVSVILCHNRNISHKNLNFPACEDQSMLLVRSADASLSKIFFF